jgi:hypothetical protein
VIFLRVKEVPRDYCVPTNDDVIKKNLLSFLTSLVSLLSVFVEKYRIQLTLIAFTLAVYES